ncbi:MAG: hypothetical protein U1F49_00560 [Rubrivivax sp.]
MSAAKDSAEAATALLPLTLRHVQADLAGLSTGGPDRHQARATRCQRQRPAGLIARVQRWHERDLPGRMRRACRLRSGPRPSPRPRSLADGRTRSRTVKRERVVPSRELSIFVGEATSTRAPNCRSSSGHRGRRRARHGSARRGCASGGYHVAEVASRVLGESLLAKKQPMFARTGVLVTNLAVHFKRGRSSSLVWVTCSTAAALWPARAWR